MFNQLAINKKNINHFAFLIVICFILLGFIFFQTYKNIPIVRNSIDYAQIIQNFNNYTSNFNAQLHAGNKQVGFSYLSLLFVKHFGYNIGLKITSFLGTCLWAISLIPFYLRIYSKFGLDKNQLPLYIVIACFNPLVFYQFISAFPDILFALSFLWSMYFLDRSTSKDIRWFDGGLFSFFLLISVWLKHYGLIIIPILIFFFCFRSNKISLLLKKKKKEFIIFILSFLVVISIIFLVQFGYFNKFFNSFNNFNDFKSLANYNYGSRFNIIKNNIIYFLYFLLLSFNILTTCFINIFKRNSRNLYIFLILAFITPLFYFYSSSENIRYYLPIMPILGLIILSNINKSSKYFKPIILIFFAIINVYTTFFYNNLSFHSKTKNFLSLPHIDNLRLTNHQLVVHNDIRLINQMNVEKNINTLLVLGEYLATEWYTWDKGRLLNQNIHVVYLKEWDNQIIQNNILPNLFIFTHTPKLYANKLQSQKKYNVTRLSTELFILD